LAPGDVVWVTRSGFASGLALAALLEDTGVPAGAPVPTRGGHLVAAQDDELMALLRWVDGEQLDARRAMDGRFDLNGVLPG
jgi:Ser/Thr protein kinase RdoA (MazF antagonist)